MYFWQNRQEKTKEPEAPNLKGLAVLSKKDVADLMGVDVTEEVAGVKKDKPINILGLKSKHDKSDLDNNKCKKKWVV